MRKVYFISDLHFCHDRDFIYEPRGFSSVESMNSAIIEKWNDIVNDEDLVFILGDVALGCTAEEAIEKVAQLKGTKVLAVGNHDTDARIKAYKESKLFEDIQMCFRLKVKKTTLILSHYPTLTDNGGHDKVYNIHGHTHCKEAMLAELPQCYNVNPEAHDCTPVLLEEILKQLKGEK